MNNFYKALFLLSLISLCFSCKEENDPSSYLQAETGEHLSGGEVTVDDQSANAFGFQAPNLTNQQGLDFFVGNSFFRLDWVESPASTTARDGVGPFMNSRSCGACHFKDGRGRVPEFNGEVAHGLLLRLSINGTDAHGGPLADPNYGGQLQDMAITTVDKEGGFNLNYTEQTGKYNDGTSYSLRIPSYTFNDLNYGELDAGIMVSPRVAPQMIGMGLLEAITESDLLSNADEDDLDNDGISGKPNYVWNTIENNYSIGRLGWKSNQPSVKQQVAGAFLGDMGITTSINPNENCIGKEGCDTLANGGTTEIDDDDLDKVALYSASLAVPIRRNYDDQTVLKGKQLFMDAKCNACHIQKFTTGTHPTISAMSNQTIYPFTDLLLHDMGDALADNRPDYDATGNEWRTSPLWGIGLFNTVNGHTQYLHDGRARNIEEAILWHGGEASSSQENFVAMENEEREALLEFLNSL